MYKICRSPSVSAGLLALIVLIIWLNGLRGHVVAELYLRALPRRRKTIRRPSSTAPPAIAAPAIDPSKLPRSSSAGGLAPRANG